MINKNNTKLKTVLKSAAALTVVACVTIGATLALLSDSTEEVTNTFTPGGGIEIDLTEPNWNINGEADHFAPGSEIPKDPTVTVPGTSSEDEYVAATVSYYVDLNGDKEYTADEKISYDEFTSTYAKIYFNGNEGINQEDWSTSNYERFYFGENANAEGLKVFTKNESSVIFDKVIVNKDIPSFTADTSEYTKGTPIPFEIRVKAYGVQSSIEKTVAMEALNAMIEGKDPNSVIK